MSSRNRAFGALLVLVAACLAATPAAAFLLADPGAYKDLGFVACDALHLEVQGPVAAARLEARGLNRGTRLDEISAYLFLPPGAAVVGIEAKLSNEWIAGRVVEHGTALATYTSIVLEERRKRWPRDPALVEDLGGGLYRVRLYPVTGAGLPFRVHWRQALDVRGERAVFAVDHARFALFAGRLPELDVFVSGELAAPSAGKFPRPGKEGIRKARFAPGADGVAFVRGTGEIAETDPVAAKRRFDAAWETYRIDPAKPFEWIAAAARGTLFVNPLRALLALEPGMRQRPESKYEAGRAEVEDPGRRPDSGQRPEGGVRPGRFNDGFGGWNSLLRLSGAPRRNAFHLGSLLPETRPLGPLVAAQLRADEAVLRSRDVAAVVRLLARDWGVLELGGFWDTTVTPAVRRYHLFRAAALGDDIRLARYGLRTWDIYRAAWPADLAELKEGTR